MPPPHPWGNVPATLRRPTEKDLIRHNTSRDKVISVMNRIHREGIDRMKFMQQDFMGLLEPKTYPTYDEGVEVELKMKNCVGIETLVTNVGRVLTGKFFLCRTITPSSRFFGVDTAVEDVEGRKAMRLALFNYSVARMGISDFETVLPLRTVMMVKNPVFKKPETDSLNVNFGVIVQNPVDVEFLSPKRMKTLFPGVRWKSDLPDESRKVLNSPLVWEFTPEQTDIEIATKLKNVGNKAFLENRATDAIRFYNIALEYLPEEEGKIAPPASSSLLSDILSNKAAALIKLDCFNPALICTTKVLEINNGHVKAIYRHAKALIGLGRYSESGQFLDEKLTKFLSLRVEEKDILKLRSIIPYLGKPLGK